MSDEWDEWPDPSTHQTPELERDEEQQKNNTSWMVSSSSGLLSSSLSAANMPLMHTKRLSNASAVSAAAAVLDAEKRTENSLVGSGTNEISNEETESAVPIMKRQILECTIPAYPTTSFHDELPSALQSSGSQESLQPLALSQLDAIQAQTLDSILFSDESMNVHVWIDEACAEALRWHRCNSQSGLDKLFSTTMHIFTWPPEEEIQVLEPSQSMLRLVILQSSFVLDVMPLVAKWILSHYADSTIQVLCCVATCIHEKAHYSEALLRQVPQTPLWVPEVTPGGYFSHLAEQMTALVGLSNVRFEVEEAPAFLVRRLTRNVVVVPCLDESVLPWFISDSQRPLVATGATPFLDDSGQILPLNETVACLQRLALDLKSLLDQCKLREHIYTLGPVSRRLAQQLLKFSTNHNADFVPVSLILVDRTLDLVQPTQHGSDHLLDHIFQQLAMPVSASACDRLVPNVQVNTFHFSGTLAHGQDPLTVSWLDHLMNARSYREGMALVRHRILDTLQRCDPAFKSPKVLGRPTAQQLQTFWQQLKDKMDVTVSPLLLWLYACVSVSQEQSSWEQKQSVENIIMAAEEDAYLTVFEQLRNVLQSSSSPKFTFEDVLALAVYAHALFGSDRLLPDEMIAQRERNLFATQLRSRANEWGFDVESFLARLPWIAFQPRELAPQFAYILDQEQSQQQKPYIPLIQQLVQFIFDPMASQSALPEQCDLQYMSNSGALQQLVTSTFTRLLKTTTMPHPNQHSIIFFFMVGGVTWSEMRTIRDVASRLAPGREIYVGGTSIATASSVLKFISGQ